MSTPIFAYDEPDNFAGVKFGEDVRTQILPCAEVYNSPKDERCWYQSRPDAVRGEFNRLGEISTMTTGVHYLQIDGKLERVHLIFKSDNASDMLAVLKQRYGQPTSIQQRPFQTTGGVKTTSTHAEWRGKNIVITFDERIARIDTGLVEYATDKYRKTQTQEYGDKLKKAAGGL